MWLNIFYLFIIPFYLHATDIQEIKRSSSEGKASFSLLNSRNFLGDRDLQNDGIIRLRRLSAPVGSRTLFSGKEIDSEKERRVIGEDKRESLAGDNSWMYPGTCIASLEIHFEGFKNYGTGFLISPNHVLTAAHNIYDSDRNLEAKNIICYFGRYKDRVKDYCEVESFIISKPLKDKNDFDFSLLILKRPMGKKVGYIRPMILEHKHDRISIQGYPARYYKVNEEERINSSCQYKDSSNDISIHGNYLHYSISTTSGQSGAPILIKNPEKGDIYPLFVGMHISGAEDVKLNYKKLKKYPYKGIRVTIQFLQHLEFIMKTLENLKEEHKKIKKSQPYHISDEIYFYVLNDTMKALPDSSFSSTSSHSNSSSNPSLEEISEIKNHFSEKAQAFLKKGDYQQAKKIFKEAKRNNINEASHELAKVYSILATTTPDKSRSFKYLLKATQEGQQARDQFETAERYSKGIGVEKNDQKAFYWYSKAADQNHADSQYSLGNCYYYGYGTSPDKVEANKFYTLAKENGCKQSSSYCSIM